ncbi:helix-turn-helix domain-containing protein [Emticicia fontis]
METLKEKIEVGLRLKGVNAKTMCAEIGITEATLYNIYKKENANYKTLKAISDYLNVGLIEVKKDYSQAPTNDKVLEYFKKENEFLKGFIRENLAINFNIVSSYATVLG